MSSIISVFGLITVFSAVTLPLLPHSQGNIWLFEESVLITRNLPGRFTFTSASKFT